MDRERLTTTLAGMVSLTPNDVDVADDGHNDRNWDAPVICTVAPLAGDFRWHLDVYLTELISSPPPEGAAAAWLAAGLQTAVAYQAQTARPSAFWLVGPDGKRTRARVYEEDAIDDEPEAYRIDAVEHPVTGLPGLAVAAIPEVIREHHMPTPVADRLRDELQPPLSEKARQVTVALRAWESMVTRLTEGWPPDGWYPAEYYREDLQIRDDLAAAVATLSDPARTETLAALAEVDERFVGATEDDGGVALAAEVGPVQPDRWWWRRVPRRLPWLDEPGP
ncbi:hypothetical protein [Actinoplanes solisilvae]|uniref:hypothetical protein n=1 Tax=Actinoplanes solisilvae TaxID=2486853 RepID=UPI000FD90A2C|nr:hypothetical protein [Actinoplanes solisilvae]